MFFAIAPLGRFRGISEILTSHKYTEPMSAPLMLGAVVDAQSSEGPPGSAVGTLIVEAATRIACSSNALRAKAPLVSAP